MHFITKLVCTVVLMVALCGIGGQADAALVTQLDITGGTIDLNFGALFPGPMPFPGFRS